MTNIREVSLYEVAKYLPKDHPDLVNKEIIYELW